MKKLLFSLGILLLISCKNENQENFIKSNTNTIPDKVSGKELFENKGNCIACHQKEQKVIGPSLSEIASTYKAKNRSIVLFLKEESEPIIDPSQYDIMKANFAITKNMSDDELKAIEDYIYTFSK
ncbi:MAG: c-type cytochrome [Flavobacterium sp.]|uniref:c-type cytochrome n=1 Tax=Flavobacterium sp. TaxID=239 RepID=UPI003BC99C40